MNHVLYKDFLDRQTQQEIIDYVDTINENFVLTDHHLKYLISKINGKSYMYDLSKTDLTSKMTLFQSGGYVMKDELPNVFHILLNKIADKLALPKDFTDFLLTENISTQNKNVLLFYLFCLCYFLLF